MVASNIELAQGVETLSTTTLSVLSVLKGGWAWPRYCGIFILIGLYYIACPLWKSLYIRTPLTTSQSGSGMNKMTLRS